MIIPDIFFGALGIIMYSVASYYCYKVLKNFERDSQVAGSMFFLKDTSDQTFRTVSLLILTAVIGEFLILAGNYVSFGEIAVAAGRLSLIVTMFAAVYYFKMIADVTSQSSED